MKKILLGAVSLLASLGANAGLIECSIIPKSQCPHAEFSGKNLAQANLQEAHLLEGDLSRADLTKANLKGANIFHGKLVAAISPKRT